VVASNNGAHVEDDGGVAAVNGGSASFGSSSASSFCHYQKVNFARRRYAMDSSAVNAWCREHVSDMLRRIASGIAWHIRQQHRHHHHLGSGSAALMSASRMQRVLARQRTVAAAFSVCRQQYPGVMSSGSCYKHSGVATCNVASALFGSRRSFVTGVFSAYHH